ncbi:MAG TPA: Calx-beta domain-containing protein, partial [Isosphaeraceae bacterium]
TGGVGSNTIAFNGRGDLVADAGAGTINQTGTNTNLQTTRVTSGTLQVIAPDAIPRTGAVFVERDGILDLNGFNATIEAILRVDGSLASTGAVTVNNLGRLEGTGTVGGTVLTNAGAEVAPGTITSTDILSTGSVTFAAGSSFNVDLNGPYTTAGTDYDQLNVTGTVDLGNADLVLSGGAETPTPGTFLELTLIRNDGSDSVTGTFASLPEGSAVSIGSFTGIISYVGGDGNDVVLITGPMVTLSLSGSPLAENGVAVITATLSDISTEDVIVDLGFGGTATQGSDYFPSATSILISAGSQSGSITLIGIDDTRDERDETIVVDIVGVTGGIEDVPQQVTAVIIDDEVPTISISDASTPELGIVPSSAGFVITLSIPSDFTITVAVATADGTATAPADYAPVQTLLTFAPGQTVLPFTVPVNVDGIDEDDETFFVTLSNPTNATIARGQGVATIFDIDLPPALSIDDVAVAEGDAGPVLARFAVRLSAPSSRTVTLAVATADGSASAPADYTPVQTLLTFATGQTALTVDVPVNGDTLPELDETFSVILVSGAINATIARGQGIGTIRDDDAAGVPQFLSSTFAVAEDAGSDVITIVRTGGSAGVLSISFVTADGTATAGRDYTPVSGMLVFGPGQTSQTFTVPILDDLLIEGGETVLLILGDLSPVSSPGVSRSTAVLTIVDDDSLVVTNTADDGRGSLRRAIQTSNDPGNPPSGTISFAIPGAGVRTIQPLSALPAIERPVSVDATMQPGFVGTPIVELDGSRVGSGVNGLVIAAGSSAIRGLAINRFAGSGIVLLANGGNTIQGNFIGTDASGFIDLGNDGDGVLILDASDNLIGGTAPGAGNVLSGNGDARNEAAGITMGGRLATGNRVQGNRIGTDATGTRALGNSSHGVFVSTSGNRIGGTETGAGNVISANGLRRLDGEDGVGIYLFGGGGNAIYGNLIGTDATGSRDLGNSKIGVLISDSPGNTIGGPGPAARNVISGNGLIGLDLAGAGATGNVVQGNFIGLDGSGLLRLGNGIPDDGNLQDGIGVFLNNAPGNLIGGVGAGNVISGNLSVGVQFLGPGATGNRVQGNLIGTDATGAVAVGNVLDGVSLDNAPGNLIGGRPGEGNVIAGNGGNGLHLNGPGTTDNSVRGNLIGLGALEASSLPNG